MYAEHIHMYPVSNVASFTLVILPADALCVPSGL